MTVFNYVAYKEGTNEQVKGKVEAEDLRSARSAVRELGFTPISVVEEKTTASTTKQVQGNKKMPRLGLSDQIDFTSTLQILAAAGIPIIESLLFIENDAAKLKIRQCAG